MISAPREGVFALTLASEVGSLLTYEATKDLSLEDTIIDGWNGKVTVQQIKGKKITIVPILRAGTGMMGGVLDMIPSAKWSFAFTAPITFCIESCDIPARLWGD